MKNISIVIPVFNEEKRLKKTFAALQMLRLSGGLRVAEVIFVNDGSTDSSLSRLKTFVKTTKVPTKILSYKENRGKGFAVKKGMLASSGDYSLLCDADMSTPFSELVKFEKALNNDIDIILGTRKNGHSTVVIHQPKYREVLGKVFTKLTQQTLGLNVTDFTCGFKLFSKESVNTIFPHTIIDRWGYDAEIVYLATKNSLSLKEVPVLWSDDKGSHVNVFVAAPQTLIELGKILATHSFIPFATNISVVKSSIAYTTKLAELFF